MDFNVSAFSTIRPGAVRLYRSARPKNPVPQCNEIGNPLAAVVSFAKHTGLDEVPALTIAKLKTDSYYKYCFYLLRGINLAGKDEFYQKSAVRLKEILLAPDSYNDRDLYCGLVFYLNNFMFLLPGQKMRLAIESDPQTYGANKTRQCLAIGRLLGPGGTRTAISFLEAANIEISTDSGNFARRASYFRLGLQVFNKLVAQGEFSPQQLWA